MLVVNIKKNKPRVEFFTGISKAFLRFAY
jgi:hypothetical protein